MKLTLGFSPCPNDTFIFDALVNHKIDTEGLSFEVSLQDVESLNNEVFNKIPDICKISYHAYAYAWENYLILNAGSALGFGVGPLLISQDAPLTFQHLQSVQSQTTAAIPGRYTTANFLLGLALPELTNKTVYPFSEIEEKVLQREVDCGLIIHENRFTYQEKGLHKIIDLGDFWEKFSGAPIPLGGIVINRKIDKEVQLTFDRVLKRSIEYAFTHPASSEDYVKAHAQEMDDQVIRKHINLYVNEFSLDLGNTGKKAVELLYQTAKERNIVPTLPKDIFLTPINS